MNMAKSQTSQPTSKFQKRDWVIIALVVAMIGTNWVWYQKFNYQDTTNKAATAAWQMNQEEISKLKACIDVDTKPCDITPEPIKGLE